MIPEEIVIRQPRSTEGPEMIALMRRGVVEALKEHKRNNRSVIAWDREIQQIVEIPPSEIVIPETETRATPSPLLTTDS
jgi:hypothetical protein